MPTRKIKTEILLAMIAVLFGLPALYPAVAQTDDEVAEAARFLNETTDLSKLKIYKLADTEKAAVAPQIADKLITSGELFGKLNKSAKKVLDYHGLSNHCNIIAFDFAVPTVFTYKLRSISFSSKTLEILNKDEISALVAHEIGHLYLARDWADARINKNARAARIAELKCDAVALVTLKDLGINPVNLISAVEKLIKARKEVGFGDLSEDSASVKDRKSLIKIFLERSKNREFLKKH
ncbi:MAG: hypothetical protein M3405_04630 [Acidobacteriota bacterium]|nr:hypothetical protein [Acidobacteriota bacterium]